jgi:bla regulator protein blaR1
MTLSDLSPLANHLWQSTVFAIAAWLLTLALRKNRASVRYWIWLAASLKFLIPFSLLVTIGNKFAWHSSPTITQPQFANVINQISQPFATLTEGAFTATPPLHASSALPIILLATWLCGAAVALIFWLRSLQQIRAIKRTATPLPLNLAIPVMSSSARMEPGVFGIISPVLILPEGIADRLSAAQMNAVIAHELCHIQRKDNLTAAIHMLVETTFWFHPMVWWIRTRLVAERERSCDEAVLSNTNNPQIYAEAILNVCKLYIESPVRCVSGVTGANLKKRIREIVSERVATDLNVARKFALAIAAVAAIGAPIFLGLIGAPPTRAQSAARPQFEVISIKPDRSESGNVSVNYQAGRFTVRNFSLKRLIYNAYHPLKIVGDPNWLTSEKYDIDAKVEDSLAEKLRKLPPDQQYAQVMLMLQSALEDRFQLKLSHESQYLPVYVLVVAKGGPKLTPTTLPSYDPEQQGAAKDTTRVNGNTAVGTRGSRIPEPGQFIATGQPIAVIIGTLSHELGGSFVLDQTGLKGEYDFTLKWTPDSEFSASAANSGQNSDTAPLPDPSETSIFTALQEQLGLKLETKKAPVDVLVITHVERLSGN